MSASGLLDRCMVAPAPLHRKPSRQHMAKQSLPSWQGHALLELLPSDLPTAPCLQGQFEALVGPLCWKIRNSDEIFLKKLMFGIRRSMATKARTVVKPSVARRARGPGCLTALQVGQLRMERCNFGCGLAFAELRRINIGECFKSYGSVWKGWKT